MEGRQRTYHPLTKLQWLIWLVIFWMMFFSVLEDYPMLDALNYACLGALSYAIILYGNALWLIPHLYRKKKYLSYAVIIVLGLVAITWLRAQIQFYIYYHLILKTKGHLVFANYAYPFVTHCLFFIFSIAFRFTLDYFSIKQQQEQLLKQHAEAQLNLLKAQVQPHFLFNTLNNIYFVAQRESPLTADLIEKLSSIMRYFLEQGPHQEIPLSAEMGFIRNYIELEKMRIRHPVKTTIEVPEDISQVKIPPMLLIPLVENVFKHGIDKRGKNNYISIRLQISDRIHFRVCNHFRSDASHNGTGWGIGLNNLSKRLQILYGDNYQLVSDHSEDVYISNLTIPL
jgi:sensor histidine kinase YesM